MIEILITIAFCYVIAGVFIVLAFDHADMEYGDKMDFLSQAKTVLIWPDFVWFAAHQDEYMIDVDSLHEWLADNSDDPPQT